MDGWAAMNSTANAATVFNILLFILFLTYDAFFT